MKYVTAIVVLVICMLGISRQSWAACCSYGCCDCSCIAYSPLDKNSFPKTEVPDLENLKVFFESVKLNGGPVNQVMIPVPSTGEDISLEILGRYVEQGEDSQAIVWPDIKCRPCCVDPGGCGICCDF